MRLLLLVLVLALLAPAAEAQAVLRVRVTPLYDEVSLAPGEMGMDPLSVDVEFRNTDCRSDAKVTVSIVLDGEMPSWAGASVNPMGAEYAYPRQAKETNLEVFPSEDAPPGESVTYRLRPTVTVPNQTACPTQPQIDAPLASVVLLVAGEPAGDGGGGDGGSPSPGALALLLVLAGIAFRRRRS